MGEKLSRSVRGACTLLALSAWFVSASAQITSDQVAVAETLVEVRVGDGAVHHGRVIAVGSTTFTLETGDGARIEVPFSQVAAFGPARGRMVGGEFWPEDPGRAHLLLAPSARPLRRGEVALSGYWLFFPLVGYGVTGALTVAGGAALLPGAIGDVFYLAPKVTLVARPGLDIALASVALSSAGSRNDAPMGVLYGVSTFSRPSRAFTVGAGVGFREENIIHGSRIVHAPLLLLGFEASPARRYKLLSENWFGFPEDGIWGILTGGVRAFRGPQSADFAAGIWFDDEGIECCLPIVRFGLHFGGP